MIRSLGGKIPVIDPTAFVSEAAYIVGDVEIGPRSSVWPGVVIRADAGKIKIGAGTNIQDNSTLHADADASIGDDVTIGHGVVCHARTIGNGCLLGNGSILNDGVVLGDRCLVSAGSVVTEDTVFEEESLIRGVPGKSLGKIREKHAEIMRSAAAFYINVIPRYEISGLGHTDIRSG
ncbi:MAG: gamma carbonic anhydrase family protein [Chloroflexi bacterium]|nr:gamma carbonic anhydrase family protein [Chloroflexota bacterium]